MTAVPAPIPTTLERFDAAQLIALKRVCQIAVAPDGTWAAASVQRLNADGSKYLTDLWRVPLDGSDAVQLTRSDHSDTAPSFRADGALAFLSNRPPHGGKPDDDAKDRRQVWLLPAQGGEPYPLTDEPLGVDQFLFAPKGDRLVCIAPVLPGIPHDKQRETMRDRKERGPSALRYTTQPVRHWDHWLPDGINTPVPHVIACAQDGTGRRDLTPDALREHLIEPGLAISPDGSHAAITSARAGSDRIDDIALLLVDLGTGAMRIVAERPRTEYEHPCFSPDGTTLACIATTRSREHVGKPTLTLIDVGSGGIRTIAAKWDRWPALGDWTRDGRALIVAADDDGCAPVFRVDAKTGTVARLSAPGAHGTHSDLHVTGDGTIVGIRSTLYSPPEIFRLDSNAAGPQPPRMLAALSGFAHQDTVTLEDIRVTSTDGTTIQSWIVKPANATGPLPVLFVIHGGPIGMFGDGWHWRWNALTWANAGYLVVLPNARGSTGFGQEFIQGIWCNQWGGQCYSDLMAVADAIEQRPDVDPKRIAALGGSFGGYMTNWIGGNTGRFKALATHASVFSMSAFTGVTDHPAYWMLEMNGDPYSDAAAFDRFSPARFVHNWKSPTLIIHGEKDYRCPVSEGLALFEALQHFGIESEIVIFPDENHWILKPRNIIAWNAAMLDFFGRHLAGAARD
jgi:dipeptidyl aminopeptidase/acylaminoacyl peptidase